jgi:hypothetical protein
MTARGVDSLRHARILNGVFVAIIVGLLTVDVLRHAAHLPVPFPPLLLLEAGVLLVSIKIVWMLHAQTRVEHFQFWILSSLEFRLGEVARALRRIEDRLP